MSAVCIHVPKYCLHKARGLAYVRDRGKVCYLGKYGSPESKEAYGRFLIKWEAQSGRRPLPLPKSSAELTRSRVVRGLPRLCRGLLPQARPADSISR